MIRVLHVDDEPEFTDLVSTFLEAEEERFRTETASGAEDGMEALSEGDFDCVISDYDMPGKNGIEFLNDVREDHPDLPFILYTGKGSEEIASDAISAGVTDYLQKDTGTDQYTVLANRVRNAVEQRRAERDRDRHIEAIETADEGIAVLDRDRRYVYCNRRFADLYGYDPDGLVGEPWEVLYRDEDIPWIRDEVLPEIEDDGYWRGEITNLRADGDTVEVDHTASLTDRGEMICTARDISEEKKRERELRTKTTILEALFERSPDMINVHDTDGNFIDPNPKLLEKTGYDEEDLADMKVWDLDRDIDREEALGMWESMDVGDSRMLEGTYRCEDGSDLPVEVHIRRLRLDGKDRFVAISRDITEQKEYEKELKERNAFIQQSLDALEDVFYVFGPENEIIRWNDRLSEVTGYTDEEIEGMSPMEFFPEDHKPRISEAVAEVIEEGSATVQADFLTTDGERIPHEFTGFRLTDPSGDTMGFVGIGRDLREKREYESRLEARNERLEEFASIVSHDLRNPLSVAEGELELARKGYGDHPDGTHERMERHLDIISEAHERMGSIIEDLLTLSREGAVALDHETMSLADLAHAAWMTTETGDADLSIDRETTIEADESRVIQMFENLFGNAVEHGGEDVTLRVGELEDEDGFYVADDGPGIPEEERARVFESGVTTTEEGIGVGLSIVKRVTDAHGWDIEVTESRSGGARFEVTGVEIPTDEAPDGREPPL